MEEAYKSFTRIRSSPYKFSSVAGSSTVHRVCTARHVQTMQDLEHGRELTFHLGVRCIQFPKLFLRLWDFCRPIVLLHLLWCRKIHCEYRTTRYLVRVGLAANRETSRLGSRFRLEHRLRSVVGVLERRLRLGRFDLSHGIGCEGRQGGGGYQLAPSTGCKSFPLAPS
jgi:hypothetical protein